MTETIIIEAGRLERNYWLDLGDTASCFGCAQARLGVRYKQT
jgi:hypothetical protein